MLPSIMFLFGLHDCWQTETARLSMYNDCSFVITGHFIGGSNKIEDGILKPSSQDNVQTTDDAASGER